MTLGKELIDVATKTKIFQFAFSGLSSKLEIVARLSILVIEELKMDKSAESLEQLLEIAEGFFFNNLFAKLRYFTVSLSDKHVHLCLVSLKDYAPRSMAKVAIQILELIG